MKHHAFFERLGGFPHVGGHLVACFEAGQMHASDPRQPSRAPGGIHGHVAPTDYEHVRPDRGPRAGIDVVQELQPRPDVLRVFTGHTQSAAGPGASGHEDRVERAASRAISPAFRFAPEQFRRVADAGIGLRLDTHVEQVLDFVTEHIVRKSVARDAVPQHAAQQRLGVEDRHAVTHQTEVRRGRQPGRTPADDGHGLLLLYRRLGRSVLERLPVGVDVVGSEALQVTRRHRLVMVVAVAFCFARMLADAPANCRQRAPLADDIVSLLDLSAGDQGDIALHVHAGRARDFARSPPGGLGDAVDIGNRLGIGPEDGLPAAHLAVKLVRQAKPDRPQRSRRTRCTSWCRRSADACGS